MSHEGLDTLEQLQTPQQVELLDKIDDLRSQGLGHYDISLPQLIVCGNQSSGKSSLLERLTRLRFPTGDNMCTKFATEVVLRKEKDVEIEFTITPGKIRSKAEKFGLGKFKQTFSSRESFDFRSVTEEAKKQMLCGAKEKDNMIFEDILRVRYSGPDLPSLTVVDLPGLIETDVTRGDAVKKIDELVTRYMKDEKSIILAILDASNDVNCQKVFEHLKIFDPTYSRTLGILTKTDLLEPGSKKEEGMLEMAKNEGYLRMRHRWHAVSNRKFGVKDPSLEERDEAERKFFGSGLWSSLPEADVGITSLRAKLSRVLLEHIGRELPSLVKAVKDAVATTEAGLKLLGTGRDTVAQQRSYLASHALNFHTLTNDALRGIYGNPFFALSSPDKAAIARLRTKVQNLNIAFTQTMYTKGHTWNIASTDQFSPPASRDGCSEAVLEYGSQFEDPEPISREEFLESHIGACVRDSRQSGLPSLVNPLVVGEIFRQQSHNWRDHATYHLERVFTAISDYVEEALRSLVDPYTCSMLMIKQVRPELDRRWSSAEAKLEELLLPYTEQEPITYDPSFVHQLDALRMARYAADCTAQETSQAKAKRPAWFRPQHPTKHLLTESIDEYTNSEILDLMQTYYRNAISVFINNIAILGIENCLLQDLSGIFSPQLIIDMDDELLSAIASEPQHLRDERAALKQKLQVLQSGKNVLSEHMAMRPSTRITAAAAAAASNSRSSTTSPRRKVKAEKSPAPPSRREYAMTKDLTPEVVDELTAGFNSFSVTSPVSSSSPSSSRDRSRSHARIDSGVSTPVPVPGSKTTGGRHASPYGPPRNMDNRRMMASVSDDTSDGEY